MLKVSSFAYTVVCVYVPLSTLFLSQNNDTTLQPLQRLQNPMDLDFLHSLPSEEWVRQF